MANGRVFLAKGRTKGARAENRGRYDINLKRELCLGLFGRKHKCLTRFDGPATEFMLTKTGFCAFFSDKIKECISSPSFSVLLHLGRRVPNRSISRATEIDREIQSPRCYSCWCWNICPKGLTRKRKQGSTRFTGWGSEGRDTFGVRG